MIRHGGITIFEGLEAVQKRPAMYFGDTGARGLHHLVYEVVDNSIDEAQAGHCTKISVVIHRDNSITVSDNGRGIPVEAHPKFKEKSVLETVLTVLHAGPVFENSSHKVSRGLHRVGVSCVNALSTWLNAEVKRDGHVWAMRSERGTPTVSLKKTGTATSTGTTITFLPDPEIFEVSAFCAATLRTRLRELAFLCGVLHITFEDSRGDDEPESFEFPGGVSDYVAWLNRDHDVLHPLPMQASTARDGIHVELALQFSASDAGTVMTFVNGGSTPEGGTHLDGLIAALKRWITAYTEKKEAPYAPRRVEAVFEGLTAVISVHLHSPEYAGATKNRIMNAALFPLVEQMAYGVLEALGKADPTAVDKLLLSH